LLTWSHRTGSLLADIPHWIIHNVRRTAQSQHVRPSLRYATRQQHRPRTRLVTRNPSELRVDKPTRLNSGHGTLTGPSVVLAVSGKRHVGSPQLRCKVRVMGSAVPNWRSDFLYG